MKPAKRGFTLIEFVAVAVIGFLLLMLLATRDYDKWRIEQQNKRFEMACMNNLKLMGMAIMQYEMTYGAAPAYSEASATTTADGNLTAANLMRLYSCGLNDVLPGFRCPIAVSMLPPKKGSYDNPTGASYFDWIPLGLVPATVRDDPNGGKYTTYNLTTCYSMGDPANKIIVADTPFAKGCVTASAHDAEATKIDAGPNVLFKDGHVVNAKSLCPVGSSEHDLSPKGNIYRVDGGEGKGKDTCILGVER